MPGNSHTGSHIFASALKSLLALDDERLAFERYRDIRRVEL